MGIRVSTTIGKKRFGWALGLVAIFACAWVISGCSQTTEPQAPVVQQMQGAPRPVTAFSGFLGDYTLLQVGGAGQAQYRYINPDVSWTQYTKIEIEPVTFWAGDDSKVSSSDQQVLTEYFYNSLREQLSKHLTIVDEPGPGTIRLQVALTDAESAVPVMRTISVVVPQARVLSRMKQLATGSFAFVGGARAEGKATDSQTGQILGEFVDERLGSNAVRNAATWQWGDAERAMDFWSQLLAGRLAQLQQGQTPAASGGASS